jgi:tripartite-type tricarboxylate transporter receptor subunit TctC
MNSMAGTDVLHVPYRGSAPAVTDVATGAVTMSFSSLAAALPLIQDWQTARRRGDVARAHAATARRRVAAEAAPSSRATSSQLVRTVRDRATPEPIVARLNEIVATGLRDKAIAEKLEVQGIVPRIMSPAQYREFVRRRPRNSARSSRRPISRRRN